MQTTAKVVEDKTRFIARDGAGAPEDRRGQPVQMVYDRGAFYVVNWDEKRQDYRNYHLGRINTAADTGENFDVPKTFDRQKLLRKNFSAAYGSGDPERVVLHFHPRVKPFIVDRDWHDTQELKELPNGIIVLTLDVSPTPDFIAWIGEFHNDCRVIAPATLRAEILKKRQEAARETGWTP